jgi:hypothetical protein
MHLSKNSTQPGRLIWKKLVYLFLWCLSNLLSLSECTRRGFFIRRIIEVALTGWWDLSSESTCLLMHPFLMIGSAETLLGYAEYHYLFVLIGGAVRSLTLKSNYLNHLKPSNSPVIQSRECVWSHPTHQSSCTCRNSFSGCRVRFSSCLLLLYVIESFRYVSDF